MNGGVGATDELRITHCPPHFSYAPLSKESVLLRTLRSISSMREMVQSLPPDLAVLLLLLLDTSPQWWTAILNKLLRQLRGLLQDPRDGSKQEQRGGSVDLKVAVVFCRTSNDLVWSKYSNDFAMFLSMF